MKKHLIEFYLSWVNDYLTVNQLAIDNNISIDLCNNLISVGRDLHESDCKDTK